MASLFLRLERGDGLRLLRSAVLCIAAAYLVMLGWEVFRISQVPQGQAYWFPDWGILHGEPFVIVGLGVYVFFEAALMHYRRKSVPE